MTCVEDLRRFVRTQVLGRCLDELLMTPPTLLGVEREREAERTAGRVNPAAESLGRTRTQLEALSPATVLYLAAAMEDTRVGLWVKRALEPCISSPGENCDLIARIPPDMRYSCLSVCAAYDESGSCWRLMRDRFLAADSADPAYRSALMAAVASAPTEQLFNESLSMTLNASIVRPQDLGSMISLLAGNPKILRGRAIVWDFAKRNYKALSAAGGGAGAPGFNSVASSVASGFASEEDAQDVEIFIALHPELNVPERIERTILGRIRSQAIWLENYGPDTCAVLEAYHA